MQDRLRLICPIAVEGKYDKIKLSSVVESDMIVLDGFGIFKNREKSEMLKRIADKKGLIVLTDSDGGGLVIRNRLRSLISSDKLIHLYVPEIKGKERRKSEASKEGLLGVEGMETSLLYELLLPFSSKDNKCVSCGISKAELYSDGLLGGKDSAKKREALCTICSLPKNLSSNALAEALNLLYSHDEYKKMLDAVDGCE